MTIFLILANAIVFALVKMNKIDPDDWAMSYYTVSVRKEYRRIFTSAFTHESTYHFLVNMYSLYNVGHLIEYSFGSINMLLIYFVSFIVGKILTLQIRHNNHQDNVMSLGASGAIFGLLGAYFFVLLYFRGFEALSGMYGSIISMIIMSMMPGIDGISHISCFSIGIVVGYIINLLGL